MVLKEHMRKKFHKCINPHNKTYDKFYINNYLEPERTWEKQVICNLKQEMVYFRNMIFLFL